MAHFEGYRGAWPGPRDAKVPDAPKVAMIHASDIPDPSSQPDLPQPVDPSPQPVPPEAPQPVDPGSTPPAPEDPQPIPMPAPDFPDEVGEKMAQAGAR